MILSTFEKIAGACGKMHKSDTHLHWHLREASAIDAKQRALYAQEVIALVN
jgi:hypothetical protein